MLTCSGSTDGFAQPRDLISRLASSRGPRAGQPTFKGPRRRLASRPTLSTASHLFTFGDDLPPQLPSPRSRFLSLVPPPDTVASLSFACSFHKRSLTVQQVTDSQINAEGTKVNKIDPLSPKSSWGTYLGRGKEHLDYWAITMC